MTWFCIYPLLVWRFHLVHGVELKDTPTLGSDKIPRLVSKGSNRRYDYEDPLNHSVFSYQEESEELYVGGTDFVLKLDANDLHLVEKYPLNTTGQQECHEGPCKNVITIIEKFQDSMFVCGTNGQKPKCWKLFPSVNNQSYEIVKSYEGTGISPFVHTQNSLSLTVEGDLYTAAPLDADGSSLQFRRKAGSRTNVWMHDSWVSEPTFISASWVKRVGDPDNEKIYVFFREKNSDLSPEADPWISRVARVCKVDEGGSKRFFQNMWTSFLKARLVCGFPEESLYFNRLLEIHVMHAEDWHETRVYALFSSCWNSTAVCIYSIEAIEAIFENSTFRGFNEKIPNPRPGTCVADSKTLSWATVNVVKDHPEMTGWVHPLHKTPFYISNHNYTKLTVDRVQAADQQIYNVLILATDSGKIHKVLEAGSEPFIISETQLSNNSVVQAITLDSKKKKLIVGFSEKISIVDLQGCEEYKDSCAGCVLARDPYCSWTAARGCSQTVPGGIQNIMSGNTSVCHKPGEVNRSKRSTASGEDSETVHVVPQGVPFYLSCPIDSYHAAYTWEHKGLKIPCLQMLSNCLHLIPSMKQENYGHYNCVSVERDFTKSVKTYRLVEQQPPEDTSFSKRDNDIFRNDASGLAQRAAWTLLQTVLLWRILDYFCR